MVDFLVALAQALCVCGLIYGAYLSIRFSNEDYRKAQRPRPSDLGHSSSVMSRCRALLWRSRWTHR